MRPLHRFTVLPTVPDALTPLRVLAHTLRWSWHPATQELFREIGRRLTAPSQAAGAGSERT